MGGKKRNEKNNYFEVVYRTEHLEHVMKFYRFPDIDKEKNRRKNEASAGEKKPVHCYGIIDGKECKLDFDSYLDFEEHFCRDHLKFVPFICAGKGCTQRCGAPFKMIEHFDTCKGKTRRMILESGFESSQTLVHLEQLENARWLTVKYSGGKRTAGGNGKQDEFDDTCEQSCSAINKIIITDDGADAMEREHGEQHHMESAEEPGPSHNHKPRRRKHKKKRSANGGNVSKQTA